MVQRQSKSIDLANAVILVSVLFLQTFMLLAKEAGLDTCAQEAWSMKQDSVAQFVKSGDDDMLFCGMCIGYRDNEAPVNSLISERRPLDEWAKFL